MSKINDIYIYKYSLQEQQIKEPKMINDFKKQREDITHKKLLVSLVATSLIGELLMSSDLLRQMLYECMSTSSSSIAPSALKCHLCSWNNIATTLLQSAILYQTSHYEIDLHKRPISKTYSLRSYMFFHFGYFTKIKKNRIFGDSGYYFNI